mmetsp:Transcript_7376/g.11205  ORF Transcript_7376/g.11205 Transcript_7376/m.11205 type:complete len:102 (-) Transcript_7376:438-743(-)
MHNHNSSSRLAAGHRHAKMHAIVGLTAKVGEATPQPAQTNTRRGHNLHAHWLYSTLNALAGLHSCLLIYYLSPPSPYRQYAGNWTGTKRKARICQIKISGG